MGYTNDPVPQYVYNHGPPDTLQIFSIKVECNLGEMDGLCWPLHVFGLIALRDSIDQHRNVIFNRTRDDCQIITKHDPYLVLTGPTRAVVMNDATIPVTMEAALTVKSTDGSLYKYLIFEAGALPSEFPSCTFDLIGGDRKLKLKIALARVVASVEATIFIRVLNGTWPIGFSGQLAAFSQGISRKKKIVLAEFGDDGPITDNSNLDLSRFVVSVESFGDLVVCCKAWRGEERMEDDVMFKAEKKGKSCATLTIDCTIGSCTLEVLVAWSPIRPVCEELVSVSEMVYAK
ncbi:uncharacterized protein C2845_PM01G01040 [Panicum miliaceum]|uniref:DUF6598 domain-containing protein n=1 Tax=Panicum miliaceum TaxID=4540 RepID=A0A3L6TSS8_PANMI|nr:uncharacterized protein C2845_PM01G01040 [Panicum miliaceum]